RFAAKVLSELEHDRWLHSLILLTLGQVEASEVLAQAATELERCQAYFYAGARLQTIGRHEFAHQQFDLCVNSSARCAEWLIASLEQMRPPTAVAEASEPETSMRVRQLNHQALLLFEQGRPEQGVSLVEEACELARQDLSANHPDYVGSLNNLGA